MKKVFQKCGSMVKTCVHNVFNPCALQRATVMVVMFCFCTIGMYATSKGAAGFARAITEMTPYQAEVSKLLKCIAGIICLIGAFNVYFKMQNGDQDVKKTIMLTIGGCVAFIAMSEALPLFFS